MNEPTEPDEQTVAAERAEAERAHRADRPATEDESETAEQGTHESGEERRRVAEHFHEMNEIGANTKGEGSIE